MATKSIIEIDLLDEKFQAFNEQMLKLQSILEAMPGQWKNIAKEIKEAEKAEAKAASQEDKDHKAKSKRQKDFNKEAEKAASKEDKNNKAESKRGKDFNKVLGDRHVGLVNVAKITTRIAKDMADTAVSAAKWLTFGAIASGFGLGALAAAVSSDRRAAQGLGITTGQYRSAKIYGERYFDVDSLLGNLADIQSDIRKQPILARIGVKESKGKNAAELLPEVATQLRGIYQKYHGQQAIIEATGATQLAQFEVIRRLGNLTEEEFKLFIRNLHSGNDAFKTPDELDRAWQTFKQNLEVAGKSIELTLITGLNDLTGPLGDLAKAIGVAIGAFLKNPHIKEWLTSFGEGIKSFAVYLSGDDFKKTLDDFLNAVADVAEAVGDAAKWIAGITGYKTTRQKKAEENFNNFAQALENPGPRYDSGKVVKEPELEAYFKRMEIANKLPEGILSQLYTVESDRGKHLLSPAGAEGPFGLMPETSKALRVTNPYNIKSATEGAVKLLIENLTRFNGDVEKALAAWNWNPHDLDLFLSGGSNWTDKTGRVHDVSKIPDETVNFLKKMKKGTFNYKDHPLSHGFVMPENLKAYDMFNLQPPADFDFMNAYESPKMDMQELSRYSGNANGANQTKNVLDKSNTPSFMQTPNVNVSTTLDFKVNVATGADIITQIKAMNPVIGYA